MKKNKIVSRVLKTKSSDNKKDVNKLYLNYINALIKSENLQNKLEKICTSIIDTPDNRNLKRAQYLNQDLNNQLVKVMLMQNLIDYISVQ